MLKVKKNEYFISLETVLPSVTACPNPAVSNVNNADVKMRCKIYKTSDV